MKKYSRFLSSWFQYGYFLYGVFFLSWSAHLLLWGFWLESVVNGIGMIWVLALCTGAHRWKNLRSFIVVRLAVLLAHTIFFLIADLGLSPADSVIVGLVERPAYFLPITFALIASILLRYGTNLFLFIQNGRAKSDVVYKTAFQEFIPFHFILILTVAGMYFNWNILLILIILTRFILDIVFPFGWMKKEDG